MFENIFHAWKNTDILSQSNSFVKFLDSPPFSFHPFMKFPHISCLECTSQTSMIKFQYTMTTLCCSDLISCLFLLSFSPEPQPSLPPSLYIPLLSLLSSTPLRRERARWRDTVCANNRRSPYMKRHTYTQMTELQKHHKVHESFPHSTNQIHPFPPWTTHTPPFIAEWSLPQQAWLQIHCTVSTIITHSGTL